ncbi:MAG: hypothetical protein ACRYFZ_03485 [Janthinobacterium lividum]
MLHTFTVPVKPHVRKYLEFHLGQGYKLTQLDAFGRCLKMLLQLKPEKKDWDKHLGRYKAKFGVSVEGNLILQKRLRTLTSKSIIDFNNFVEGIIKTECFGLVANCHEFGMSQYGAIQAFREKYDFQDEDMSHDTLKKAWQRYKSEPVTTANSINLVSVCPLPQQRIAA